MNNYIKLIVQDIRSVSIKMARWEYVTVVAVQKGIIQLIEPNGNIACYRQAGITKLPLKQIRLLMINDKLDINFSAYPEIPSNYVLQCEAPEIMGKVYKDFTKDKRNFKFGSVTNKKVVL